MARASALVLALILAACTGPREPVPTIEYRTVKVPIATRATAPPELLTCLDDLPAPRFVPVRDANAVIGIRRGDEPALRQLISRPITCALAWKAWATAGAAP